MYRDLVVPRDKDIEILSVTIVNGREFGLTSGFAYSPSVKLIDHANPAIIWTLWTPSTPTSSKNSTKKTSRNGDRLAEAEKRIDWEAFRPIIKPIYTNDTPRGGRPNVDEVVMVKLLVLQAWYGLSDPELERQALNRIDFQHFLGFPADATDYSTVWSFRERLAESGRDKLVWAELQRQLDEKG